MVRNSLKSTVHIDEQFTTSTVHVTCETKIQRKKEKNHGRRSIIRLLEAPSAISLIPFLPNRCQARFRIELRFAVSSLASSSRVALLPSTRLCRAPIILLAPGRPPAAGDADSPLLSSRARFLRPDLALRTRCSGSALLGAAQVRMFVWFLGGACVSARARVA
jgi:hypothetical protein